MKRVIHPRRFRPCSRAFFLSSSAAKTAKDLTILQRRARYLCDQISHCEISLPRLRDRDDKPVLRYPNEKFLARETGTIVVFMVGLCRGGPDQLDWCAQLRCAQQSAQNGEER